MTKSSILIPEQWKTTLTSVMAVFLISFIVFYETWVSIVSIWYRSDTFAHGFLIIPISFWLIWGKRQFLQSLKPVSRISVILLVAASGFVWLLADLVNVLVIKQFAAVGLLVSALWMILGHQVSLRLIYPLGFLFFMVPVGEELVPPLMEYTATFTVWMIRLTGMSVYREGLYFSLTSGNWSVIEACSGIRYLIASITLGFVYAYLTYSSLWKRAVFVGLSIIIPIIANGFRAYMIVMVGHISDMTLAVGVDHIIYGAVFFGLVMLMTFYVGSFFRDSPIPVSEIQLEEQAATFENQDYQKQLFPILIITIIFSVWPVVSNLLNKQQQHRIDLVDDKEYLANQQWQVIEEDRWKWRPDFQNVKVEKLKFLGDGKQFVGIYQASFGDESQGKSELVNSQNLVIYPKDKNWKLVSSGHAQLTLAKQQNVVVNEYILRGRESDLLLLYWYQIGQKTTANIYLAKIYQLIKHLTANTSSEISVIMLIETQQNKYQQKREVLTRIAEDWLNNIDL